MSKPTRLQETNSNEYAVGRRETSDFHDNAICVDSRKFEYKNAFSRRNGPSWRRTSWNHPNDMAFSSKKDAGSAHSTYRSLEQNEFDCGKNLCESIDTGVMEKYKIRPNWKWNTGKSSHCIHSLNENLYK